MITLLEQKDESEAELSARYKKQALFKWTKKAYRFRISPRKSTSSRDSRAGRRKEGKRRKEPRRGVREDLEATQFPLTAGVCFSSRYIDPHPHSLFPAAGNRTRSLSPSPTGWLTASPHIRSHARATAARARACATARASPISNSLCVTCVQRGERHDRYIFSFFVSCALHNISISFFILNQ